MSAQKTLRPWFDRHLVLEAALCLLFAMPTGIASAAGANQDAVSKVMKLNREARQFYDAMEFSLAEKNLTKALEIGEAASLGNHVVMAGTHGNIGVLYATGIKDEAKAVMHFKKALELRPEYVPSKELSSPEVKELFEQARAEMQTTGSPVPTDLPDTPATGTSGQLQCPVADAVKGGAPLKLRCVADSTLAAIEATVYFRSGTSPSFRSRKMTTEKSLDGSPGWTTQLPGEAISGDQLFLYFEAHNKQGAIVGSVGSAVEPTLVGIRGSGASASGSTSRSGLSPDDDLEEKSGPSESTWWFGMGIGTGYGYAKGDGPEAYHKYIQSFQAGAAPAKLFHLTPEIGYFLTPKLSLSLQGRLQEMQQWSTRTARGAIAFLARMLYFSDGETFRFYGGVSLGAGEGFRLEVVDIATKDGRPSNIPAKVNDTVRGGPVLLGAAGGVAVNLSESWSVIVETNALIGFPVVSMVMDFNAGIRYRL
jgi:hypothetical protein